MEYSFANTYKKDADTYIEDRGFLRTVSRGDADFDKLESQFGEMLSAGQSAIHNDYMEWEVVDGFPAKEAYDNAEAKRLRAERDRLLAGTDYLMMPDYPIGLAYKTQIEAYRQALRDMPQQGGWPWDVSWPAMPEKPE